MCPSYTLCASESLSDNRSKQNKGTGYYSTHDGFSLLFFKVTDDFLAIPTEVRGVLLYEGTEVDKVVFNFLS